MAHHPADRAWSPLPDDVPMSSAPSNQRDHDAESKHSPDALRKLLFQQGFVAKPTAYAPYGKQDDHPLRDAHEQLQARLQALRGVRGKLRFVAATSSHSSSRGLRSRENSASSDMDIQMASPRGDAAQRDSMAITTRVALSTQSTTDEWVQRGGIVALDGLETLFLGFLTTHELVTAGAVCQSWYALARRDAFWEPLLHTPVEKYPLRGFLGFHATASVPAIQVCIIYRKVRAQLQKLHAKDDEAPRQSPDALRFEEVMLRGRRAGNNNNDQDAVEEEVAMLAQIHADLPVLPRLGAGRRTVTTPATLPAAARNLHLRSVHLVFPADEDVSGPDEDQHLDAETDMREEVLRPPQAQAPAHPAHLHDRNPFVAIGNMDVEVESDEEVVEDVEMLAPNVVAGNPPQATTTSAHPLQASVLDACRRVRLQSWLAQQRTVSRDTFRSFARQLLLALATLEVSQIAHSDVCVGNILVLDRGATGIALPHASPSPSAEANQQPATTEETPLPLFQLYCRNAVNIWAMTSSVAPVPMTIREHAAHPPPVRGRLFEAQHALRLRQRQQRLMAAVGLQAVDRDEDDQPMLRHLFAPRAVPRAGQQDDAPPAPALIAPLPPLTHVPSSANYTSMVRSYIRILREVWSHGRIANTNERSLPFLSLIYLRPDTVKSISMRSFIEYAEYLLSRNEAAPSKLLNHVFLQDDRSSSPRSAKRRSPPPERFIVGKSTLNPWSFANAEDYRTHAVAWYSRYLTSRQMQHLPLNPSAVSSFGLFQSVPSTLFGPAFYHDALSESRLPFQRFLSVAAPRTASSSWVHTLAMSQRFTLQKLDLSRVELPLSILLRELSHLQRLSHLRLPREILRDENMEQFVAALWCSGLLPSLEVMDDSVKKALDRMEFGYVTQLNIMSSLLDHKRPAPSIPSLHHTFSSPF